MAMADTPSPRGRTPTPMPSAAPTERRQHLRREQYPPLTVGGLRAVVTDVSRGGICLTLPDTLIPGSRWPLLLQDTLDGSSFALEAEVVWCRGSRAGLRWVSLAPEQDAWLGERFVRWIAALDGASRR